MVALEDAFQTRIDEGSFSAARDLGQLRSLVERATASDAPPAEPVDFPAWNRSWIARAVRRVNLATWILPLARLRVAAHRGARAPARSRRPGDLRVEPPELHGRPGDHGGAAGALALHGRAGDGEGNVRGAFLPRPARTPRVVHQQPQLLPRGAASSTRFRCRSAKPARGRRCATSASCSSEGHVGADLSGGPPLRRPASSTRSVPASA